MYPSSPSAYLWTPHHYNPNPNPMHHHFAPTDYQKPKQTSPYQLQHPCCFPPPPPPPVPPEEYHHHGCCNHTYFGGAGGGSHSLPSLYFPHYLPPPPFQSYGFYPPFPGLYSVPPPHYSIDHPRYDYDKNNQAPPHRCCGCTHPEHDDNKSKIQSHEPPQLENKTNDSLAPFLFKDCPFPIMWVPPGYNMKTESKTTHKDKDSPHPDPDPDPVSLKHVQPSKALENGGELAPDQQAGDGKGFPFPIFWLPSNNREMGKDPKENNNNLNLVSHKEPKRETRKIDDGLGSEAESETSTKPVVQKVIPVKQLGTDEEKKKSPKTIEPKPKSGYLEKADNGTQGKDSPKTSKLPPVCLRIDPLPKKKKSSRSPSPPADKERSKGLPVDSSKSSLQQRQLSEDLEKSKEEQSKGNIKTIEVANAANKVENASVADHGDSVQRREENGSQKVMTQGQSSKEEPYRVEGKKNMSVNEAALIIQSVYRGFEVRKSQPLVKLTQISEVRKQVVELRKRIQDLASSSTTCINDKQKLIIGETIMSLLLKLDTIQGLHPIVRDIRKSIAKELVGLQEKLDSLTFTKSETPIEETKSSTELVMHPEHVSIQEEQCDQSDGNFKLVESEAAESHDDDGSGECNVNLETQLEVHNEKRTEEVTSNQIEVSVETKQPVDNAIQEKFDKDQVPADNIGEEVELDTCISDNHGPEATDSLNEAHGMKPETMVEENTEELKDNQSSEQPENDAIQEKADQLQANPDDDVCMMESNASVFDNRDVEVTESEEDGGTQASDMKLAPEMEPQSIIEELNNTEPEMSQIEHPLGQVMFDQTPAQFDGDAENVASPRVEATECVDDGNVLQTLDRDVSMEEMKLELPKKDAVNGIQEDYIVAREDVAPKADDVESYTEAILEDLGGAPPTSSQDGKVTKDVGEEVGVGDDGDRKQLLEENEKLRMAVEELIKAGKEQLDVIRDLTGRVKDMENKLCKKKKKKMKAKKCNGRSCGFGVEDELLIR